MSDQPPQHSEKRGIFSNESLNYVGVRVPEITTHPTWLPYFERLALVIWLYVAAFVLQETLDMSGNRMVRLIIASVPIPIVLRGMGIALKRAGNKVAVGPLERTRRRQKAFFFGTLVSISWVVLMYILWNL